MKIEKFEDIEAWKESRQLTKRIYEILKGCKDYSFKDQIQRASLSVMTNIAEGFDRGTNKEFIQYLVIARGSVSEVKSLAYSGVDIGHINAQIFDEIQKSCSKLAALINGFIRYLKNSDRKK